jgi:rhamnosyl/mannosyltransferase
MKFPISLKNKIIVINNSISEKDILYKKTSVKNNMIIFIASLNKPHSWKGLDKIIEAVKYYIQNFGESIELVVVGDGDYRGHYEKLAEKLKVERYVKFVGTKLGKDYYSFLRKAKILVVYPITSNDGFPTVILDAWANLVPVIASNIGPLPYVIEDKKNGYLVEPGSPKELAEGINDLMHNENLRNELIRNGLYKVKDFTWEKSLEITHKLFMDLCNNETDA